MKDKLVKKKVPPIIMPERSSSQSINAPLKKSLDSPKSVPVRAKPG